MTNEVHLIIPESSTWLWISRNAVNYDKSGRWATGALSGSLLCTLKVKSRTTRTVVTQRRVGSLTPFPRIPCGGYQHGFRRKPVGGAARGAGKARNMAAVLVFSSPFPKLRRFLRNCWGQLGGHAGPWGKVCNVLFIRIALKNSVENFHGHLPATRWRCLRRSIQGGNWKLFRKLLSYELRANLLVKVASASVLGSPFVCLLPCLLLFFCSFPKQKSIVGTKCREMISFAFCL